MKIVFDTRTNNVKRFVGKVKDILGEIELVQIQKDLVVSEPYHLVTYTTQVGQAPASTIDFLERNSEFAVSVSVSGNINWGLNYGRAYEIILEKYPNIGKGLKFELSGTQEDVELYINIINKNGG